MDFLSPAPELGAARELSGVSSDRFEQLVCDFLFGWGRGGRLGYTLSKAVWEYTIHTAFTWEHLHRFYMAYVTQ